MKKLILNSIAVAVFSFSHSFAYALINDSDIQKNPSELFQEFLDHTIPDPSSPRKLTENGAPYRFNGVRVAGRCSSFMNANEIMGPNGRLIQKELTENISDYVHIMDESALDDICPNFRRLNPQGRSFLWAVILTAMAHFESSCNQEINPVQGPNGTLRGLFQLHSGHEQSYDGSDNECIKNASFSAEHSIKCALGILDYQFQNQGKLFSNNSYWEVLRPNGKSRRADDIERALKNSSMCKAD